jgi:anaerobic magnesium-protoporphyrin IX monomethyl ester cyclase
MRVVLCGPQLEENLALGYLKATLDRAGDACSILAFDSACDLPRTARAILRSRPELVGLSLVAQRRYPEYQELIRRLRAAGFSGHITAGGHFAALRAREVLRDTPGLDTILHHDGEQRLVRLAEALQERSMRPFVLPPDLDGVTWRDPGTGTRHRAPGGGVDVDLLPFPARRNPSRTLGVPVAPIVSSRGCSGTCSFCSIHAWHRQVPHGRLRFRSPANVAQEMIALHREHGIRAFIFHDDDFLHPDPGEARSRCRAILEPVERVIGPFAFVIKCRPDHVEEELFGYLKSRGLVRAYVGIESHSQAGLRALNRGVRPETNERALALLHSLAIYSCFNLLLFHPDSAPAELEENLEFLERHLEIPFDIARAELYARSTLEDRMVAAGRVRGDYRGYDYRIADPVAETAFRLFARVLWDRHFGGASILHRSQELGYRLSLMRRFHPEMVSPDLEARVADLIRNVNADTVRHLRELLAIAHLFVSGPAAARPIESARSLERVRREAGDLLRRRTRCWKLLSLELEGRARLGRATRRVGRSSAFGATTMVRVARAAPGIVLAMGASCGGDRVLVCDPPPPPAVRFATDIEPVLNSVCGVPGCHSGETPAGELNLEAGRSYDDLVNEPSAQVPRLKRVDPGRPDSSYVVHKLQGTQLEVGGSGDRMPKQGQVTAGFIDSLRRWILQGADRN